MSTPSYDPDDVSKVFFCDPADYRWHVLAWEHAEEIGVPFSAETLAYARRLALASGRHVEERRALAELLERWDVGLVRNPVERRMALRASEQRQARLAAHLGSSEVADAAAVTTLAAVTELLGDDDTPAELDDDEGLSDDEFYADALGVIR